MSSALAVQSLDWKWETERDPSFRFEEETHTYHYKGGRLLSCTGIIKAVGWARPFQYPPGAAERGQRVHKATACLDLKVPVTSIHDEELGYLAGWQKFETEYNFISRVVELPMYHRVQLYGVTADREGLILKGDPSVVDIKTGQMKWWIKRQLALQDMAFHSWEVKPTFRRRFGVRLFADGDYVCKEFTDFTDYHKSTCAVATAQADENEERMPEPGPASDPTTGFSIADMI